MSGSPPKSVVFEAPPTTHVFQNAFFQTTVKLVDQHKAKVTGHAKALQVTLRFHDTYDVVADQSLLAVDPSCTTVDPASGTCRLNVMLTKLTAANEGRAFCLEVRALDGDLESAFSPPIHVIKEKLRIVQNPPDVWFKDEGGREKCMVVQLVLEPAPGMAVEERVVPLQLRLLYESGTPVLNQSILRLFPDMRPNMTRGRVAISFRIDDVSKNHQGQSFVLEIAPEKQETSQMFQDIAPARTSVIAIRSKRNKRKLNGLTPRNGIGGPVGLGNPLSGTPRAPGMMMGMMGTSPTAGNGGVGPPPAQRPRHLSMMPNASTPMNNQYVLTPHPAAVRMGSGMMMGQPPASSTWSSHVQHSQQSVVASSASTPVAANNGGNNAGGGNGSGMTVEWKLSGFEIHPDGTANVSRPIYRCTHCRRLVDVEMMNQGHDLHAPQCVFVAGRPMYRPPMEAAATTPQAQVQQQQQQHYYTNTTPRAAYGTPQAQSTTPRANSAGSTPQAGPDPMNSTTGSEFMMPGMGVQPVEGPTGASPRALANSLGSSSQRPVLTISPFMNKVVSSDSLGEQQSQDAGSSSGNLFASNAFHTQMGLTEMQSTSPTTEEKLLYLSKSFEDKNQQGMHQLSGYGTDNPQGSNDPESPSLIVSVGNNAMYSEMTSMGISMDTCFSKAPMTGDLDPGHPMADFNDLSGGLTDEDQVFYILARMYSNAQNVKLGLPAFDQFQRMLGFYSESQHDAQTQVVFHSVLEVGLSEKEQLEITARFQDELQQNSDAVHSLPKYQHNLVLLREDALMFYWSQSIQCLT